MSSAIRHILIAARWDFLRQHRHNVLSADFVITILYLFLIYSIPASDKRAFLILLVFNDPVIFGMLFIGMLYLFERSENTLQALSVTPLRPAQYLWSKVITLTAITVASALALAIAADGWSFNYGYFIPGVALSGSLFALIGFGLVLSCRSFNDYMLRIAAVMIPAALPVLNLFGITHTLWFYLIPSQAGMKLLEAGFGPVPAWEITYAVLYLLLWNAWAFRWSLRRFVQKGR